MAEKVVRTGRTADDGLEIRHLFSKVG